GDLSILNCVFLCHSRVGGNPEKKHINSGSLVFTGMPTTSAKWHSDSYSLAQTQELRTDREDGQ
ncbi:MAG: hypothetical protein KKE46_05540, partial [Gammaproteobacteria bacterium]|nr:hypothetical protein [Gammaproteobacteria bacterium]